MKVMLLLATVGAAAHETAQEPDSAIPLLRLGRARISAVYDVIAAPPHAYALERENLHVLDVRNPRAVRAIANLEFDGPRLWGRIHGSGLYLGGFGQPLAVVDVSEPLLPRWLGSHPDILDPFGARVVDDHLYVLEGPGLTLSVLQLTETAGFPERIATLAIETERRHHYSGFSHDAGRLYVLLERPRTTRGRELVSVENELVVIDVEQPTQPELERHIRLPEHLDYRQAAIRGDLAYVTTGSRDEAFGLAVFRLGEAEATLLGSVTDSRLWNGGRMLVNGHAIYATYKYEAILATFDVSDPSAPRLAHAFLPPDRTASGLGFSRVGDRLYVAGDAGASVILDISSPLAPQYIGGWNYGGGWARTVALQGGQAIVLNWMIGLLVYDVGDPTSPTLLGSYQTTEGDLADHVALDGDLVLFSHGSRATEVVDISDPATPVVVTRFSVPEAVVSGVLDFPRAVQAYRDGALGIVDVTAPHERRAYLGLEGVITDLSIHEGSAVAAHPDGGISVIDITDPERPVFRGRASGQPSGDEDQDDVTARLFIAPDGAHAYTLRGETESEDATVTLTAFDLGTSSGIRTLGRLEVPFAGFAPDYTILGGEGELLIAAGSDVVRIDVREPSEPTIHARYRTTTSIEGLARNGPLIGVAASEDGMQLYELPPR